MMSIFQTGLRRLRQSCRSIPPIRLLLDVSAEFYTAETMLHRRTNG
ncbi:MAG: hypothetical protein HC795_05095 [Coleofasciculaceae cyanobacterium RL_1_1]|nr:hypothetical protein [Coleofasciculaceae cyanobacterium RL_1_1]